MRKIPYADLRIKAVQSLLTQEKGGGNPNKRMQMNELYWTRKFAMLETGSNVILNYDQEVDFVLVLCFWQ
jgi:hypothetical protein